MIELFESSDTLLVVEPHRGRFLFFHHQNERLRVLVGRRNLINAISFVEMVKKSIDAKVRPLANPSLEKTSLLGAARLYVSKDSLIALTNGLESNKPCVVEKLRLEGDDSEPIRREALLSVLPEKNLSPNVVMMTRVFQEATGFKVGDQVRISMRETTPDVDEVVVRDMEAMATVQRRHPFNWESAMGILMGTCLP